MNERTELARQCHLTPVPSAYAWLAEGGLALPLQASLWFGGLIAPTSTGGPTFTGWVLPPSACSLRAGGRAHPLQDGAGPEAAPDLLPVPRGSLPLLLSPQHLPALRPLRLPQCFRSQTDTEARVSAIRMVASSSPRGGSQRWGPSQGLQPPHPPSGQLGTAGSILS